MIEFAVIFVLGLVSSLHCLQMCGPIVLAYSVSLSNPRQMLLAHAAYNSGRILTYVALGVVAGAAGSGIGMLGRMAGLAAAARIVSGVGMILMGIVMVTPRKSLIQIKAPSRWFTAPRPFSKFPLGLTLGFLPCGLIYAALIKAMDSGSALTGGLTMLAFGLGTAVALFAIGIASSFAGARLGPWSNRLAAVSVTIFGVVLLWRGIAAHPICHG
jgi:sulfite exporter TauE/SafE